MLETYIKRTYHVNFIPVEQIITEPIGFENSHISYKKIYEKKTKSTRQDFLC